ncbi:MAG: hypothetical protein AAB403_22000, partial [Planctomycetota bacterium]
MNEHDVTSRPAKTTGIIPDLLLAGSITLALGLVLMIVLEAMLAAFWADLTAFALSIGVGLVLLARGRGSYIIPVSALYVLVMFVLLMLVQFGLAARA